MFTALRKAVSKQATKVAILVLILTPVVTTVYSITRAGTSANNTAQAVSPTTLNFQARLLTSSGNLVPDGVYNVEFKIYNVSTAGTALWTETRLTTDPSAQQIVVKNGYLSAYLGDKTALPTTIWNQQLWLTMNIGGTGGTASWDGEMTPRIRLTSVPFAFRATVADSAELLSKNTGSFTGTVDFANMTADRKYILPDTSLATTASPGTICVYNGAASNCPAASGSAYYLQNDTVLQTQTNFHIQARDSGVNGTIGGVITGAAAGQTVDLLQFRASDDSTVLAAVTAGGNLQVASSVDTRTATTLSLGNSIATAVSISKSGVTTTVNGALTVSEATTLNNTLNVTGATTLTGGATIRGLTVDTATATDDRIGLSITAGGAARFDGTITNADLTAARTWTLPDVNGTFITTGNLTAINQVGTITAGTWNGTALTDAYVDDSITISSAGSVDWTALTGYPAACAAGQAIVQLGDTVTCSSFATGSNASYIQNQNASQQATSNFWISGSGQADTSIITPTVTSTGALSITSASNGDITVDANGTGKLNLNDSVVVAAQQTIQMVGGTTAQRPASPTEGMIYFDTDTKQLLTYANGKWQGDRSTSTKIVAASNSSQAVKDAADYVASGTADQNTINAALTAAAGGKVYLAEGTYTINGSISVPNSTTLAGSGRGTLITIPNAVNTNFLAITNTDTATGTGVTIQDLRLDGNKSNQSGTVAMTGIGLIGMGGSGRSGATITNVRSNNWYYSGSGTAPCYFGAGICLASSSYNIVTGNMAMGDQQGILLIQSSTNYNTIANNILQGNAAGLTVSSATDNNISGNVAQGNSIYGIYLSSASRNNITGNSIQNNVNAGIILVTNSNNNVINSNKFTDNGGNTTNNAIYLSASDSNTVTSNNINDGSATTNNYAVNIFDATSDTNYLADNYLGGGSVNDAGTGTVYAGQVNSSGNYLIQPAGTVELMKNTNVTGNLSVTGTTTTRGLITNTATATDDQILISVTAGGAGRFNGTITNADLTAARTYTLPDASGTFAVSASGNITLSSTGNITLTGQVPIANGGTGANTSQGAINALSQLTTTGDLLFYDGTNSTRFARGSNGQCLTSNATSLVWASCVGTESDTLATVTGRGATTTTTSFFNGGATIRGLTVDSATATDDRILINIAAGGAARFDGSITNADLTAARTWTLPDASGTFITTGNLTAINQVGTVTAGTWNGTSIADAYIDDNITISSAGSVDWTALTGYPAACAAGSAISQLGDTITCSTFATGTAASYIQNQNSAQQATSTFWISGSGQADTSIITPTVTSTGALSITSAANGNITIDANGTGTTLLNDAVTVAGTMTFSGVATDITTGTNEDLTLDANGTGKTIINDSLNIGASAGSGTTFTNNGATVATTLALTDFATGGSIGTAGNTVDKYTAISVAQTTAGQTLTIPSPTASTVYGRIVYLANIGTASFTLLGSTLNPGTTATLMWAHTNAADSWVFAGADGNGILNQNSTDQSANFRISGTGRANTALQAPVFDTATNVALGIGTVNATNITIGRNAGTLAVDGTNFDLSTAGVMTLAGGQAADITTQANQNLTLQANGTGVISLNDSITAGGTLTFSGVSTDITTGTNEDLTVVANGTGTIVLNDTVTTAGTMTFSGVATDITTGTNEDLTVVANGTGVINLNDDITAGGNLTFASGANRTLSVATNGSNAAGYNLTLTAGAAGSGASAFSGGVLTLQGGAAGGTGNANGGSVTIVGGAGVGTGAQGLVALSTSAFTTLGPLSFGADTNVNALSAGAVDLYSSITASATASGKNLTINAPTITTVGRLLYVANVGSNDFNIILAGTSVSISLKPNTTATLIWNGAGWTAAGASSSTDLQAAYNNTLTSAGGAELVLNAPGGAADGLTIRNNATTAITGALLEVQTSVGSNLLSVNNNAVEYAQNGGAETGTGTSFTNGWTASATGGTQATVTRDTTTGEYVTGVASVKVVTTGATTAGQGAADQIAVNGTNTALTPNLPYMVSFTVKGTANFNTLDVVYSKDGSNTGTTTCATGKTVTQTVWSRITCVFTAPSSGITSANAIFIRQSDSNVNARTFFIDNLSINVSAGVNHAADGDADTAANIGAGTLNWGAVSGSTVTQTTSTIYNTSGAVSVATAATAGRGVYNKLSNNIAPSTSPTQYRVAFYARGDGTNTANLGVTYTPDNGVTNINCLDYNQQAISANSYTLISCYFTTTSAAVSNAQVRITQTSGSATTFYVDALSVTLNTNNASNVQVGGGTNGGPTTLFTLDRASTAPIAANNDAYLGSMYYDTTTGRIQCYEADGWGACGSAPDVFVTLTPEYTGAVLNGNGIGTLTADFCANSTALTVGTLCASNTSRQFYKWTSPQATTQLYSIYVSYKLPTTFKSFASDTTVNLTALSDNVSNGSVTYEMFRSTGGAINRCYNGTTNETTVTSVSNTWQTVDINGNETNCGFQGGDNIIFKINVRSASSANVYVENLSFTYTNN